MTNTTRTHGSGAPPCSVCASIPPDLLVNTGRDEKFPPEVGRLARLGLARDNDLYECPGCDALFEWQDLPQYYGSGNCDEERLTRLDPAATAAARTLLAPEASPGDHEALRARGTAGNLSYDLLCTLLRRTARRHKDVFSTVWLEQTVRNYVAGNGPALAISEVIDAYCDDDVRRLGEAIALLNEAEPAGSLGIRYLRQELSARMAKAAGGGGTPPTAPPTPAEGRAATTSRTSGQVAAELYAALTAVCPSYAERRASPPAEPSYDMADYMHVCWDFAAHAVDMLQAGRSEELAPAFRAMAEFRDRSTEHWMEEGLAPVFERIWQEGEWRGVDVRALEHVIGPAFLQQWRRIEDPYEGDPYPIDGFY